MPFLFFCILRKNRKQRLVQHLVGLVANALPNHYQNINMKKELVLTSALLLIYGVAMCQIKGNKTKNTMEKRSEALVCKLTPKELQIRKATVLESLRKQVIEKKELDNGYSYKFGNSDGVLDELTDFIKTERQCCDFFDFSLSIISDENAIWLSLTGPKNAKDFIKAELNL